MTMLSPMILICAGLLGCNQSREIDAIPVPGSYATYAECLRAADDYLSALDVRSIRSILEPGGAYQAVAACREGA